MNCWVGSGRTVKDVQTNDSGKIGYVNLACDPPYPFNKDRDGNKVTDFLMLKFIGQANTSRAVKYITKGTKIDVRGVVRRESWNKDGEWHERNYIIVQEWEFAERRSNDGGSTASSDTASQSGGGSSDDSFINVPEDDDDGIPFK